MKRLAIVVVLLVSLGTPLWLVRRRRHRPLSVEKQYRSAKGQVIGQYLAKTFPGKRVLLLLPADMPIAKGEPPSRHSYPAVQEGVQEGMGSDLWIVSKVRALLLPGVKERLAGAFENGAIDGLETLAKSGRLYDAPAMDKALARYRGKYDLLVCLTNLPSSCSVPKDGVEPAACPKSAAWQAPSVRLVPLAGQIRGFGSMIQSGKIAAAVTHKSGLAEISVEYPPHQCMEGVFDHRYVPITPENVQNCVAWFH